MVQNSAPDESFKLIKQELVNEVKEMRNTLETFIKISEVKEQTYKNMAIGLERNISLHHEILYGDPTKKTRGIIERTNLLEDAHIIRTKHLGWIWVGVIGAICTSVGKTVTDFFHK